MTLSKITWQTSWANTTNRKPASHGRRHLFAATQDAINLIANFAVNVVTKEHEHLFIASTLDPSLEGVFIKDATIFENSDARTARRKCLFYHKYCIHHNLLFLW